MITNRFLCLLCFLFGKLIRAFYLQHNENASLNEPSLETGKIVSKWTVNSQVNPEELGEYLEGDMLFKNRSKTGMIDLKYRWKDGIVPYITEGFYRQRDLKAILNAMDSYHKYTCIRFRLKSSNDTDYIRIINSKTGCWAYVGRIGGEQDVNLQSPACLAALGVPIHELMHALGFLHEHTRSERDEFITIMWDNIKSGLADNFAKTKNTANFGVGYDYDSVMHYSKYAFSKNKKPTIEPIKPHAKIGQRKGFSKGDIIKVNKMYNCSGINQDNPTQELPTSTTSIHTTIIISISDTVNDNRSIFSINLKFNLSRRISLLLIGYYIFGC